MTCPICHALPADRQFHGTCGPACEHVSLRRFHSDPRCKGVVHVTTEHNRIVRRCTDCRATETLGALAA